MFERKNQSVLSEHYTKLVDHAADRDGEDDSEDEFITLKRADHELDDEELPQSDFMSKRKLKMANSKKALGKYGERGKRLIFDDEGNPHEIYEMKSTEEVFEGRDDVKKVGKKFAEDERMRLREVDVVDKAEAKEKKREKKRKRKEREREVSPSSIRIVKRHLNPSSPQMETGNADIGPASGPMLAPVDEDDGYVSPDFDLGSNGDSAVDEERLSPPTKRSKTSHTNAEKKPRSLKEDEELALRLLGLS